MIWEWFEARGRELSTKIGAALGATAGACAAASALTAPWSYVAFGAAILLVVLPERKP